MKKFYTYSALLFLFSICIVSNAQTVFWTEGFGKGCNQGQLANGYTTTNGTWVVASTGTNAANPNQWYISGKADGTGTGNCADHTCADDNQTLHISSNDGIVANDKGC